MSERTIKVDYLARVEGEGAMYIKIKDNKLEDVKLKIFEPPRFLRPSCAAAISGKPRILPRAFAGYARSPTSWAHPTRWRTPAALPSAGSCGNCAGSFTAANGSRAISSTWPCSTLRIFWVIRTPSRWLKTIPGSSRTPCALKKIGNDIMVLLGGREIHPINLCVGGFYKVPKKREVRALMPDLEWGREATIALIKLIKTFPMPDFRQDYEFVAMRHPKEYAIIEGRLVSNKGMDIPIRDYDKTLVESQVPHSTALHTRVVEGKSPSAGPYTCHVGPLARYSLNFNQLTPLCQETAREAGLGPTCFNPFQSILVRGIEVLYAFEESIRIVGQYEEPDAPRVEVKPRAATGYGCTEAPRGICYHRYTIDESGIIRDAKIVSPTAVNQPTIEKDLRRFVEPNIGMTDEKLQWHCEQAIRNYDPCISCSCHFLKLTVERA